MIGSSIVIRIRENETMLSSKISKIISFAKIMPTRTFINEIPKVGTKIGLLEMEAETFQTAFHQCLTFSRTE